MTTHELAISAVVGGIGGAIYGSLWFLRKHRKNGEPLNRAKLTGTILLSAGIGASLALSGAEVTPENIVAGVTANIGLLAVIEPVLKELFREVGIFQQYSE